MGTGTSKNGNPEVTRVNSDGRTIKVKKSIYGWGNLEHPVKPQEKSNGKKKKIKWVDPVETQQKRLVGQRSKSEENVATENDLHPEFKEVSASTRLQRKSVPNTSLTNQIPVIFNPTQNGTKNNWTPKNFKNEENFSKFAKIPTNDNKSRSSPQNLPKFCLPKKSSVPIQILPKNSPQQKPNVTDHLPKIASPQKSSVPNQTLLKFASPQKPSVSNQNLPKFGSPQKPSGSKVTTSIQKPSVLQNDLLNLSPKEKFSDGQNLPKSNFLQYLPKQTSVSSSSLFYGRYRCPKCKWYWSSGLARDGISQNCAKCATPTFPQR